MNPVRRLFGKKSVSLSVINIITEDREAALLLLHNWTIYQDFSISGSFSAAEGHCVIRFSEKKINANWYRPCNLPRISGHTCYLSTLASLTSKQLEDLKDAHENIVYF